MIKIYLLIIWYFLLSCNEHQTPVTQHTSNPEGVSSIKPATFDTSMVDLDHSEILWKGTKMRGMGKHRGRIEIQRAYFLTEGERISGGLFVVDMKTIQVTDIPEHEPFPRKRLIDHLKSADFFEVNDFPYSQFEITDVTYFTTDSLELAGWLSIKGITRNIVIKGLHKDRQFLTKFTFNRFQWDIAYQGSWIDKTFLDRDIELTVNISMK